jgi:hypothetical protein
VTKYAVVINSSELKFIVTDRVYDSVGNPFDVEANAYDADGNPFLIFTDTVQVVPRVEFITTTNRLFTATGDLSAQ